MQACPNGKNFSSRALAMGNNCSRGGGRLGRIESIFLLELERHGRSFKLSAMKAEPQPIELQATTCDNEVSNILVRDLNVKGGAANETRAD